MSVFHITLNCVNCSVDNGRTMHVTPLTYIIWRYNSSFPQHFSTILCFLKPMPIPQRYWSRQPGGESQRRWSFCGSGPRRRCRRPSRRRWRPSWDRDWRSWLRWCWWQRRTGTDPLYHRARPSPRRQTCGPRRRSRRSGSWRSRPCPGPSGQHWTCSCRCPLLAVHLCSLQKDEELVLFVDISIIRRWRFNRCRRKSSHSSDMYMCIWCMYMTELRKERKKVF